MDCKDGVQRWSGARKGYLYRQRTPLNLSARTVLVRAILAEARSSARTASGLVPWVPTTILAGARLSSGQQWMVDSVPKQRDLGAVGADGVLDARLRDR